MTANEARANVQACRNNQAQKAMLEIELNEKLNKLFTHLFNKINEFSESGYPSINFSEKYLKENYGKFNVEKVVMLLSNLGFLVFRNKNWDYYSEDWNWNIRWGQGE